MRCALLRALLTITAMLTGRFSSGLNGNWRTNENGIQRFRVTSLRRTQSSSKGGRLLYVLP